MAVNIDELQEHLMPGWGKIAEELKTRLRPWVEGGGRILQVKEKFGSLRVYTHGESTAPFPVLKDLYEQAEKTCIHCGEPGEMTAPRGWIIPLCEKHKSGNP